MNEPDDGEPLDPLAERRISRRTVLELGVVAVPCLAGSTVLFDWLTGLTDDGATENAEPIVARYDPTTHRWGFVVDTNTLHRLRPVRRRLQGREQRARRTPSTRGPGSSDTRRTADGTVHVDSPEGGINGFEPGAAPVVVAGSPVTDVRFVPRLCMQCENSPCTGVCPVGATYRTPDGVILVDEERCIGCGYCVVACPYGARYIVPAGGDTPRGVAGVADKCTFCYHRITTGRRPACVEACPVGARIFGDLNDPTSPVSVALRDKPDEGPQGRARHQAARPLRRPRRRGRTDDGHRRRSRRWRSALAPVYRAGAGRDRRGRRGR